MYGELPEIDTTTSGVKVRGFYVPIEASAFGPKSAILRLPTPEEEIKYFSAQRVLHQDLGRGTGEWRDLDTPKADLALFKSVRTDKGSGANGDYSPPVEFDEAEAKYALTLLLKHQVLSCERIGDTYVVELATLFGHTSHTVRLPYHIERQEHEKTVSKPREMPNGITEYRRPIEVQIKLYDAIIQSVDGYANPVKESVPPHHKRAVIYSVLGALASSAPDLDPNS